MKKLLSLVLALIMLFSFALPYTSAFASEKKPVIILKFDDLGHERYNANFQRVADLMAQYGATGGFGVIGSWFNHENNEKTVEAIKKWHESGIEIWHHGYYHSQEEYSTNPYETQEKDFNETMKLLKNSCGITLKTFGSPYNNASETTIKVMQEKFPDIKCLLLVSDVNKISTITNFNNRCDIEVKTGVASYDEFVSNYKNAKRNKYLVVQSHPGYWADESFAEFEKVLQFLKTEGVAFMTPSQAAEYYEASDKTTTIRNEIEVKYKADYIDFDVPPSIINNRTMVPFRAIFEVLGTEIVYDDATKTAVATKDTKEVKITNGTEIAYVNGAEVKLDSPATIVEGRFLVPVRFVSEAMGCFVYWDEPEKTVQILPAIGKQQLSENNIEIVNCTFNDYQRGIAEIGHYSYDGDISTVWSAEGKGKFVCYEFADVTAVKDVNIMWNKGDARKAYFEIHTSLDGVNFEKVFEGESAGNVKDDYEATAINKDAKFVKVVCNQNSSSAWNAIKEIKFTK